MDDEYPDLDNELYHHGVLGMKWGIRRYQNEDGSYTNVGRKHHADTERADYQEDNPDSKPRKGINKNTVKKAAIIAGVAVGTIAVGYAIHKSGLDRKGAEAIVNVFEKNFGQIPASEAKKASKAPSKVVQDILEANAAASENAVTKATRRSKLESSINKTAQVAETYVMNKPLPSNNTNISNKQTSKALNRYSKAIENTNKTSKKVALTSDEFKNKTDMYVSFTDRLISKLR